MQEFNKCSDIKFKSIVKRLLVFVLLLIHVIAMIGQPDVGLGINNVFPPSPEASALGKYGEYPVSTYTGVPSIQIPIYEINSGKLNLPISLSYHASGIKVEEIATNVGLGWTLNAGGVVTRSMHGLPDDRDNGYYNIPFTGSLTNIDLEYIKDLAENDYDGEPDMFYFNFSGHSGSFFFDKNQNIKLQSKEELRIEENYIGGTIGFIGFTITTPSGDKYFFGEESTSNTSYSEETFVHSQGNIYVDTHTSSWYLRKIITHAATDSIQFNYDNIGSTKLTPSKSETVELSGASLTIKNEYSSINYTRVNNRKRISSISFNNGTVQFKHDTPRNDMYNSEKLDSIVVSDDQKVIKKYVLYQGYFVSAGNYDTIAAKRLRLDSIVEIGSDGSTKPPYTFDYYSTHLLPVRDLDEYDYYDQDHWGYFNGANNYMKSLIPNFELYGYSFIRADREPAWPYTKANILEKIYYPTGGSTEFDFEPNYIGMSGPDTVNGYFVETEIYDLIDHCDEIWTKIDTSTFNFHDSQNNGFNLIIRVDPQCTNNAVNAAIDAAIIDSQGIVVKSYTLTYIDGNVQETYKTYIDTLPAGNYNLRFILHQSAHFSYTFTYDKWVNETKVIQKEFDQYGGLRIKEIINDFGDGSTPFTKSYEYTYSDDTRFSSAATSNLPAYVDRLQRVFSTNGTKTVDSIGRKWNIPRYYTWIDWEISSHSNVPLGSTQGGIVGYNEVKEITGEGHTLFKYGTFHNIPDTDNYYFQSQYVSGGPTKIPIDTDVNVTYPYPPVGNMDWARGKLSEKMVKDKTGNRVLEERYTYANSYDTTLCVKAVHNYKGDPVIGSHYINAFVLFTKLSGWNKLIEQSTTHYENDVAMLTTTKEFDYNGNNHLFLTGTTETTSEGNTITTNLKYPNDITTPGEVFTTTEVLDSLKSKYIVGVPLLSETNYNTTKIRGAVIEFDFDDANKEMLFPSSSYAYEGSAYEKKYSIEDFDDNGNILQFSQENAQPNTYLWAYNNSKPEAKIDNALHVECYFMSYEEDAGANTSDSHTGNNCYELTGSTNTGTHDFNFSELTSGKYILSAWIKTTGSNTNSTLQIKDIDYSPNFSVPITDTKGKWQYFEVVADLTSGNWSSTVQCALYNASGGDAILVDDIRFHPLDAQMTTYTYEPLIGVTSVSDVNSLPVYYDYDEFGRLILMRNHKGEIIEQYDYNYQNQ